MPLCMNENHTRQRIEKLYWTDRMEKCNMIGLLKYQSHLEDTRCWKAKKKYLIIATVTFGLLLQKGGKK